MEQLNNCSVDCETADSSTIRARLVFLNRCFSRRKLFLFCPVQLSLSAMIKIIMSQSPASSPGPRKFTWRAYDDHFRAQAQATQHTQHAQLCCIVLCTTVTMNTEYGAALEKRSADVLCVIERDSRVMHSDVVGNFCEGKSCRVRSKNLGPAGSGLQQCWVLNCWHCSDIG